MMVAETVDRETGEVVEAVVGKLELGGGGDPPADFPDVRLDPRFVRMRQGRPFVSYPGLLDLLHQLSDGYFAVETEVVQLPGPDNGHVAVCIARVRIFDAQDADVVRRLTTGIGDADPSNVSAQMRPHLLRMAETRAKARALRDAVNVGVASLEELGPDEGGRPAPSRSTGREVTSSAQGPSPVADVAGERPQPEGITIEGTRYTRDQIQRAFHQRFQEAQRAGLVEAHVGSMVVGQTPLPVLVGLMQDWKKRLEAKAGAPGK